MKFYSKESLISNSKMIKEDKIGLIKTISIIEQGVKYYFKEYTNFLPPSVYILINDYYISDDFTIKYYGGIESAERKIVMIKPYYEEFEDVELPIIPIEINFSEKFSNIDHRDVLGSLMALGIKRDTIGDIYVHDSFCHIIIKKSILEFLLLNFRKVRNTTIFIKEISFKEVKYCEAKYNIINVTISSNRLDTIISKGFNIDRVTAKKKVNSEIVKVNHKLVDNPHLKLNEGDLISVRGEGRIILYKFNGISKKDKLRVSIKKII
ncbi:MAG: YlmH/Sll1252 family protein [Bacillota bacterium]|nr:YlmH/Sll1252 family protein [Bacillota bacterium]